MSGEVVGVDEEPVSCTFDPVVSENSNHGSSREFVLVDQSAQPVVSMYASRMVPEMPAPTVRRGRQRERNGVPVPGSPGKSPDVGDADCGDRPSCEGCVRNGLRS